MLKKLLRRGLQEANEKRKRLEEEAKQQSGERFSEENLQEAFSLSEGNSAALDSLAVDIRRELEAICESDSQEDHEYKLLLYRYQ